MSISALMSSPVVGAQGREREIRCNLDGNGYSLYSGLALKACCCWAGGGGGGGGCDSDAENVGVAVRGGAAAPVS